MPLTGRRGGAIAAVAVAALYAVPYAGYALYPLLLAATAIHELGHAVVAAATGGHVDAIVVAADGSGATRHSGGAVAAIAAAGPLAPSLVGAALVATAGRARARRWALAALAAALLVGAAVWLRGAVALGCGLGAAAWCVVLAWAPPRFAAPATAVTALGVGLAWLARREELFAATAATPDGRIPTDVRTLAAAAGGPPATWAWVVVGVSVAALVAGVLAAGRGAERAA